MSILEYLNEYVICNDDGDFGIDVDNIKCENETWKARKELYEQKIEEELS